MIDLNERVGADFKVTPTYSAQTAKNLKEHEEDGADQEKEKPSEDGKGENIDTEV